MDKKIAEKVRQCKALQGKTVLDIMKYNNFDRQPTDDVVERLN